MLPDDLKGKEAIELGCGTAHVSSWLARRGAKVVGIDNSEAQLETAEAAAHRRPDRGPPARRGDDALSLVTLEWARK